jgi:hypothetical protein
VKDKVCYLWSEFCITYFLVFLIQHKFSNNIMELVILVVHLLHLYCRDMWFNLLKPTGHVMHQQFNIQQLYVLPTLYLCVLYLSENKQ